MFPITFAVVEYSNVIIIASRRNFPCYMPYQSVTLFYIYIYMYTYAYTHTYILSAFVSTRTSPFKTSEFSRVFCERGFAFDYDRTHLDSNLGPHDKRTRCLRANEVCVMSVSEFQWRKSRPHAMRVWRANCPRARRNSFSPYHVLPFTVINYLIAHVISNYCENRFCINNVYL